MSLWRRETSLLIVTEHNIEIIFLVGWYSHFYCYTFAVATSIVHPLLYSTCKCKMNCWLCKWLSMFVCVSDNKQNLWHPPDTVWLRSSQRKTQLRGDNTVPRHHTSKCKWFLFLLYLCVCMPARPCAAIKDQFKVWYSIFSYNIRSWNEVEFSSETPYKGCQKKISWLRRSIVGSLECCYFLCKCLLLW